MSSKIRKGGKIVQIVTPGRDETILKDYIFIKLPSAIFQFKKIVKRKGEKVIKCSLRITLPKSFRNPTKDSL